MTISDFSAVFGMIVVALSGAGTAGKYYTDNEFISRDDPAPYNDVYVLVSAQNLKLLYEAEDELEKLRARDVCDKECIERKATLKERIRHLKPAPE
jgi:hypothetical protein